MDRVGQLSRFWRNLWREPDAEDAENDVDDEDKVDEVDEVDAEAEIDTFANTNSESNLDSYSESSDNMSSSGRATTAAKGPKAPVSLDPTIIIGEHASLGGTELITVGRDTIVQSRAKLDSTLAPVTLGSSCILSEKCHIGLQSPSTDQPGGVVIEDYVIIEVGAVVEAKRVGEGCVVEVYAKLGKGSIIGKHCKIGPCCVVEEDEVLPDYTVIYGSGERRVDNSDVDDELKLEMVRLQIQTLKRLLQNSLAKFQ